MIRLLAALCLLLPLVALAQDDDASTPEAVVPHEVFLRDEGDGRATLLFIDLVTGQMTETPVTGERFTLVGDRVMYFDTTTRQVMLAAPDGTQTPHPFVQMTQQSRRIDWAVDAQNGQIAWTVTGTDGQGRLSTRTTVAALDGSNARPLLTEIDTSNSRLRALPLGFSPDGSRLVMDSHPDGIGAFILFEQYVGLFTLDTSSGERELLPGEVGNSCICGADVWQDQFVRMRLRLSGEQNRYELHIYNLRTDDEVVLPVDAPDGFITSGDVLISPDGSLAIYTLAEITAFNTAQQRVRTQFVVVDLARLTQTPLTPRPLNAFLRPIAWTEDNSAVLFINPQEPGTWKIALDEGQLEQTARATYIGLLGR